MGEWEGSERPSKTRVGKAIENKYYLSQNGIKKLGSTQLKPDPLDSFKISRAVILPCPISLSTLVNFSNFIHALSKMTTAFCYLPKK